MSGRSQQQRCAAKTKQSPPPRWSASPLREIQRHRSFRVRVLLSTLRRRGGRLERHVRDAGVYTTHSLSRKRRRRAVRSMLRIFIACRKSPAAPPSQAFVAATDVAGDSCSRTARAVDGATDPKGRRRRVRRSARTRASTLPRDERRGDSQRRALRGASVLTLDPRAALPLFEGGARIGRRRARDRRPASLATSAAYRSSASGRRVHARALRARGRPARRPRARGRALRQTPPGGGPRRASCSRARRRRRVRGQSRARPGTSRGGARRRS